MRLGWIDWGVVLVFVACSRWIGLCCTREASQSVEPYSLGNRAPGWWLAGTSMVASLADARTGERRRGAG